MKHTIEWEDDGLVGVNCHVVTSDYTIAGTIIKRPTYVGAIGAEGSKCEACGMHLTRTWKVILHETAPATIHATEIRP